MRRTIKGMARLIAARLNNKASSRRHLRLVRGRRTNTKDTETMPKGTTTTRIKTARPVTDSELLNALKNSMGPIFEHYEKVIEEAGGSAVLHIEVRAKEGNLKLSYGFEPVSPSNVQAMASADNKTPTKEATL